MTRARASALGAAAALLWLLLGLWLAPRLGLHIDEASYLTADLERMPWFAAARAGNPAAWQPETLHYFWRYTVQDCHPFLLRLLTGLTMLALPAGGGGDGIPLAWRLPNIIIGTLAMGMVTAVAARLWGLAGWLGAAAALLASPRFLAYAFLATNDPTVTFLGALAALAAWAWLPRKRCWLIVPAALATAERYAMMGQHPMALRSADAAMQGLQQGTVDYLRAQDIAMTSRAVIEQQRKKR